MPYSEAQKRATAKYMKNNLDELKIRMPKGKKEEIRAFAEGKGKSLNSFVNEAIDDKIERDK
ncbi:MAG: hypothetical protein BWY15_01603 [Firmicutes bacterium ADurb.Bin193]|nr:MAG: hypothetical protein BWY15_01603 [Firmicutes bacterium ADurb.Bin193]